MWRWLNPLRIIWLYRYPNLLLTVCHVRHIVRLELMTRWSLASSSLVWNMYSLLTPIRYVLNPRFELTSPLQSGLFYIAPGCGYLLGTFFGGRWADHIVKKYIGIRGERVAEDRLRSCLFFLGGVIPACMLVYGWSVEKRVGGVALPVIMMFLQGSWCRIARGRTDADSTPGFAQLFCFPSLNTYCLDVMQGRSAEVICKSWFNLVSTNPID
jgi:MFS family permease